MFIPHKIVPPPPKVDNAALPLERCLGKTRRLPGDKSASGRTVEEHCRIVGAVAEEILRRMPQCKAKLFPAQAHIPALLHDVGKVWAYFQYNLYKVIGESPAKMPELRGLDPELAKKSHNSAVSMAALEAMDAPEAVVNIVGQHHGYSTKAKPATCGLFGGETWQNRRQELVYKLAGEHPNWPLIEEAELIRLVAGLTILADWIGSGPIFDDPATDWQSLSLVEKAVDEAGYTPFSIYKGMSFKDVFDSKPRPAQEKFYEHVTGPGVYVLEAPMGMGKTKAALYAAYKLLEQEQATGLYFALPTQLTSDRIHIEVNKFLAKVLQVGPHAQLVHSKAWMQKMGADAAPEGSWFSHGKRGILAPFAVGTIDQALMAAMHVKHGALRAFGLAGKIVVLDEVHSYDAYTGCLLDALVDLLLHYNCTVIILSATLTASRRAAITHFDSSSQAYPLVTACPAKKQDTDKSATADKKISGIEYGLASEQDNEVQLRHGSDDEAMEEALQRAEQGERVLWIENTVPDAQERYRILNARFSSDEDAKERYRLLKAKYSPDEELEQQVGLLHSRFTPADREKNEESWTKLFAPKAKGRGKIGYVLVGTQVLEQSLDLDADFLVTRFCPTDMLLQRMGRLWRHEDTQRPAGARRQAWILHPALDVALNSPEISFGRSGKVYAPYVLCRSLELWHELESVRLPADIRSLLEKTYAERTEDLPALQHALNEVEKKRDELRRSALHGISTDGATLPDHNAATRANGIAQVDVLLLREWDPKTKRLVTANNEELILSDELVMSADERFPKHQEVAEKLAENVVRVPIYDAPGEEAAAPAWLKRWFHCGDNLQVLWLGTDTILHLADSNPAMDGTLRYNPQLGYIRNKSMSC